MIPDTVVQQVRDRADIVDLLSEYLQLKRAGKDFKALCPFHTEKTPSFYVVPAKGFYNCFGCGESGDIFTFLMKRQGLGFTDAVRVIAARVGVEIPEEEAARRQEEAHRAVYEAVAFAADYYRRQLAGPKGEKARRYLKDRGIDDAAVERFQIGYAPNEWRGLREAAHKHGIEDAVLDEAGLIKKSEKSDEPYDRLRDRVIFPTTDLGGRIVAFGGRVLGPASEGAPKYLNSPETPIYHKGRLLYGIHWARAAIRREEVALVVEGYLDYVSLASRGVENVVAGLGTAMTAEQAQLLSRYADKVLLLYDSDAAGLRATFRTADALLREGVHPLVVTLPPGEDPDSVVRKGGAAALKPYLDDAVDVLERKLLILEQRGYFADIEGIRKAIDGLLPTLRAAQDAALKDIYIARVAERTGVRRETLAAEADATPREAQAPTPFRPSSGSPERGPDRQGHGGRRGAPPGRGRALPGSAGQRKILLVLLRDASRIAEMAAELQPDDFSDPGYRNLFDVLSAHGSLPEGDPAEAGIDEAGVERLSELMSEREEITDADRILADSIADVRVERRYRRMRELDELIPLALERGEPDTASTLMAEKSQLARANQGVGQGLEAHMRRRSRPGQKPE